VTHHCDEHRNGAVLRVVVQPRSRRDELVGPHGDGVRVRVTAPPVGGRANEAVLGVLARVLGVDPGSLQVTAGSTGRRKRVLVRGLAPADVEARLAAAPPTSPDDDRLRAGGPAPGGRPPSGPTPR
jgi:uncharacterized protein (TIGR00251 family)